MTPKRKATPVVFQGLESGLRMFRWVTVILLVLFLLSGIQRVEPDNVGLLLRFGKLQGASPGEQIKQPGLLMALPFPIDQVLKVPGRDREGDVVIDEVWKELTDVATTDTIDPVLEGYCLTGDQNIVQAKVVVKYKITDPIAFQLRLWSDDSDVDRRKDGAGPEALLRDVVLAALAQTVAGWSIDDVFPNQQRPDPENEGVMESLAQTVWRRAQERLDALAAEDGYRGCGMTISALEFQELHPPRHVIADFQRVQSAQINMETLLQQAKGFAASELPKAEADRNRMTKEATAYRETLLASANAEVSEFEQLYAEYKKSPELVWPRIYYDTIKQILDQVGEINFLLPGMRVILQRNGKDLK